MNSYQKICTDFYDTDKPSAPPDALAFYLDYARAAGGPVLEPMCGSGRFLAPMLEADIDIDGLDASSDMLQACRDRCAGYGFEPDLRLQLLHELDMPRQYGLVYIPAGSFTLISDRTQARESLRRIYAIMLTGAKFVFEADRNPATESYSSPWGGRWVEKPDGSKIVISWLGQYDAATGVASDIHRYDLIKDGRLLETEFEDIVRKSYFVEEMTTLLKEAGFIAIRFLRPYTQQEIDDSDQEYIVECVKS